MARNTAPKPEDQDSRRLTLMRDIYSALGNKIVSVEEVSTEQSEPTLVADWITLLLNGRANFPFPLTIWERIKSKGAPDDMITQSFDKVFRDYCKRITA